MSDYVVSTSIETAGMAAGLARFMASMAEVERISARAKRSISELDPTQAFRRLASDAHAARLAIDPLHASIFRLNGQLAATASKAAFGGLERLSVSVPQVGPGRTNPATSTQAPGTINTASSDGSSLARLAAQAAAARTELEALARVNFGGLAASLQGLGSINVSGLVQASTAARSLSRLKSVHWVHLHSLQLLASHH